MNDASYLSLAEALDRLPNGYPRTESGVELLILGKLFSPEEASLAATLGKDPETAEAVAERAGLPPADVRKRLMALARRGLVWPGKGERGLTYRLAAFIVGIYEAQAETIDHELAHLIEDYMDQGGAKGIMGPLPSLHRVVPSRASVKSEWILPYDDVIAMIHEAQAFSVRDCICRKEQELLGRRECSSTLRNCLSISPNPRSPRPGDLSREEAMAILDQAEREGLVHTVSNVLAGVSYVCNCCGCCCGILRGITRYGLEHSVAAANYRASIDPETCTGCEVCEGRCQVKAIAMRDGIAAVDARKCIGCGLCVSGCAAGAASLGRKSEAETVQPPADFAAWERARLKNRGLA
jgi:electron transport complex protein RnfB